MEVLSEHPKPWSPPSPPPSLPPPPLLPPANPQLDDGDQISDLSVFAMTPGQATATGIGSFAILLLCCLLAFLCFRPPSKKEEKEECEQIPDSPSRKGSHTVAVLSADPEPVWQPEPSVDDDDDNDDGVKELALITQLSVSRHEILSPPASESPLGEEPPALPPYVPPTPATPEPEMDLEFIKRIKARALPDFGGSNSPHYMPSYQKHYSRDLQH